MQSTCYLIIVGSQRVKNISKNIKKKKKKQVFVLYYFQNVCKQNQNFSKKKKSFAYNATFTFAKTLQANV